MSADSKLSTTNLKFTDTSSNVGKLSFGSDVFTIDKTANFSSGINVTGVSVSSGSVTVSSQDTLKLAGSTSGELTLQAAATTTDYTLTMPASQGSSSTVLSNDGSGNLSWAEPNPGPLIDLYGTKILDWTVLTSPSSSSPSLSVQGNAGYTTAFNNYYLSLMSGTYQTGYLNFDAGSSYSNWKFEVKYKILSTSTPADVLWFFGQGTQTNSGNEGAHGGVAFQTDYYNSGTWTLQSKINIYNGSGYTDLYSYTTDGYNDIFSNFATFTMIRYGNKIYVERDSYVGNLRYEVTSTQSLSGTRWGVGARCGGYSMNVYIGSMRLTVLN